MDPDSQPPVAAPRDPSPDHAAVVARGSVPAGGDAGAPEPISAGLTASAERSGAERAGAAPAAPAPAPAPALNLLQIVGDELFAGHRADGTGFGAYPAPARRGWMDETKVRYAYRCLPVAIANQAGLWLTNPVGFTVRWDGGHHQGALTLAFDRDAPLWSKYISSLFGHGVLTWNMPFMFRTTPPGSQILITGPANRFKAGAQALQAIVETDWMNSSFTMNWRILQPHVSVRFEAGEPILQVLPLMRDALADLEAIETFVSARTDAPKMFADYEIWMRSRDAFRAAQARGEGPQDGWQRDYFQGRDVDGHKQSVREHHTKVRAKPIRGTERLGLAAQPVPAEENLSVALAPAAGRAELDVEAGPAALPTEQRGEALAVCLPQAVTVVWHGGSDYTWSGPGAAAAVAMCEPLLAPGAFGLRTGLTLRPAAGFCARVRAAPRPGAAFGLDEAVAAPGGSRAALVPTVRLFTAEVPVTLSPGPLALVEMVADTPRLALRAVSPTPG